MAGRSDGAGVGVVGVLGFAVAACDLHAGRELQRIKRGGQRRDEAAAYDFVRQARAGIIGE